MTKIMIGLPSKGDVSANAVFEKTTKDKQEEVIVSLIKGDLKPDTVMCLMNLAAQITLDYGFFRVKRAFAAVDDARNMIVDEFLKSDCTHLLFIDWDATFPSHAARTLIEADKDIIGVNAAKHETGNPVITHNKEGKEINYVYNIMERVDAIGMHLTMTKRRVFETMEWPWFFRYIIHEQRKMATEDFTFCKNADQNYGFEIWVHNHLSAEIGHISSNQVKTLKDLIKKQIKEAREQHLKKQIEQAKQEEEKIKN